MSMYGLIKASSRVKRAETINDLWIINRFRSVKGLPLISPKGQSIRKLENAVALMCDCDTSDLPKLLRGVSFYKSILDEAKKEK